METLDKFELSFECEVVEREAGGNVELLFRAYPKPNADNMRGGLPPAGVFGGIAVPLDVFGNAESRHAWRDRVVKAFRRTVTHTMLDEARINLLDAGNFFFEQSGLDPQPVGLRGLVKMHLAETEARVRGMFGTAGVAGRPSNWTASGLSRAITESLAALPPRSQNYAGVAARLREIRGTKEPASGGALRQLVIRLKLDWKELKRTARERRKAAGVSYTLKNVGNG